MGVVVWTGGQQETAQVVTAEVTAYDAATTYSLAVGVRNVSVVAAGSADLTAAALAAAWAAEAGGEFAEAEAEASTDTVTLTAVTPGTPFTVVPSASGGTGTIGSVTTVTTNKSPNDLGDAENWSTGVLPTDGDDVFFENSDVPALWRLDALSAVTLASLTRRKSFTGRIGLPDVNESGGYREYRAKELTVGATAQTIEIGDGDSARQIRINNGSAQTTLSVTGEGTSARLGDEAVLWRGTHASNAVSLRGASLAAADAAGTAATIATLRSEDSVCRLTTGCTLTTVNQYGGELQVDANVTTWTLERQAVGTIRGSATATTIDADDGSTFNDRSSGTKTTVNVGQGASVAASSDKSRTYANCVMAAGSALRGDYSTLTLTNGIDLYRCGLEDVTVELGKHYAVGVSAI